MQRIVNGGHGKVVIPAKAFEEMAGITYPFLLTATQQYPQGPRRHRAEGRQRL